MDTQSVLSRQSESSTGLSVLPRKIRPRTMKKILHSSHKPKQCIFRRRVLPRASTLFSSFPSLMSPKSPEITFVKFEGKETLSSDGTLSTNLYGNDYAEDTQTELSESELLREKLFDYLKKFDRERLFRGFEDLVNLGQTKGEEFLDSYLEEQFGCRLSTFIVSGEEVQFDFKNASKQQKKAIRAEADPDVKKLRTQLYEFFVVVDPKKLEHNFQPLINYYLSYGRDGLNASLRQTFRHDITDFEKFKGDPLGAEADEVYLKEVERVVKKKTSTKRKKYTLPKGTRKLLKMYYRKHDPERVADGSVEVVYEWAKRNGIKRLNRNLKHEYAQSLRNFEAEKENLEKELVQFYTKQDQSILGTKIFYDVLIWGLRHGRTNLTAELAKKYGYGLFSCNDL
eukprot:snap_masked-scaffold_26-processed-gene-1.25-mRNA-1 protein AED:1.00 eAED:1.00 QI:0/-1/0/0/-1/1/1/0/396